MKELSSNTQSHCTTGGFFLCLMRCKICSSIILLRSVITRFSKEIWPLPEYSKGHICIFFPVRLINNFTSAFHNASPALANGSLYILFKSFPFSLSLRLASIPQIANNSYSNARLIFHFGFKTASEFGLSAYFRILAIVSTEIRTLWAIRTN